MKTSGAGTWVSATSQNTPTSISPPIHMEDTFEAPKAHAYHCAVSIKKPNFSRNAIIMFSGVRNIKSDKINRDLHLLSIKTNSSKRTPTVGMSWCKQVNVEGQAPAELCHMNATRLHRFENIHSDRSPNVHSRRKTRGHGHLELANAGVGRTRSEVYRGNIDVYWSGKHFVLRRNSNTGYIYKQRRVVCWVSRSVIW